MGFFLINFHYQFRSVSLDLMVFIRIHCASLNYAFDIIYLCSANILQSPTIFGAIYINSIEKSSVQRVLFLDVSRWLNCLYDTHSQAMAFSSIKIFSPNRTDRATEFLVRNTFAIFPKLCLCTTPADIEPRSLA